MRATRVLLGCGTAAFAIFFFKAYINLDEKADVGGRAALGAFEFFGAIVSLYLLSRGNGGKTTRYDWLTCAFVLSVALAGVAGTSITIFALYLFFRDRVDLNTKAAGTVAAAVAIQAIWAP